MAKLSIAAAFLILACGRSTEVPNDAGTMDSDPVGDAASDAGSDADVVADAGSDAGPDVSFPETGCEGDRWCWVMGAPIGDIHGAAPNAVFAVGAEGIIRIFDGTSWRDHSSPTRGWIDSVVARSANAVWILTEGKVWHYDGFDWALELEDDPTEWPTDMLVLDESGALHTARRRYTGGEWFSILRTYVDGTWVDAPNRSVVEASPAASYDALRPSLLAYEHAYDPEHWGRVPAEAWVNGANAVWGSDPSDIVTARHPSYLSTEVVWQRGAEEIELPLADSPAFFYPSAQERSYQVAGFADGSALIVHERQMFVSTRTGVRELAGPEHPTVRALDDGRVALFDTDADRELGTVRLLTNETEGIEHVVDLGACPTDPEYPYRGALRMVDVDTHDDEIWISVMQDHSRTGTPCLLHFDGESWAARLVGDPWVLMSFGYMLSADASGALLVGGRESDRIEVMEVPRAFMRSGDPLSSLVRTPVPEADGFREWMSPRIWRGPTGVWLYENDQALFRRH